MKAKLGTPSEENNAHLAPVMARMEVIRSYHVIVVKPDNRCAPVDGKVRSIPHELIKVKIHGGRSKTAQRIYADILLTDICGLQDRGFARAKDISAALAEAIKDAGVELSEDLAEPIDCNYDRIHDALQSIAMAMGHGGGLIIED